ncbi:ferritin-like domain-containing protein [Roridomyces roridus]|uniref:Ferritin-like domain-containing protein n=1 Tax=Roridomyces roridus TaxID=1738132 RepID=A0AAD7C3P5_9AGAR|nr:ferritin-like domain-containing protein [Roridomyces roridus]
MRYSYTLFALASPLFVSALPFRSRSGALFKSRSASATDALVFNFANVLEQLESSFYAQAIAKFSDADFSAAGFSNTLIPKQALTTIQSDEAIHQMVLAQALIDNGATPLQCNFNFDNVLTDVTTVAATARTVEYLGVTAYLGAATLLDDPILLDAAASILTVEARHQTLLNILSGTGSAVAQPFDIPFVPGEALSLAAPFITGDCNTGITPTNLLTITNTGPISQGQTITVSAQNITGTDGLFCNMIVGGATASVSMPLSQCVVPSTVNGAVALWVTADSNPLPNNVVDRAKAPQVAGPAIFFVDSSPEMIGQLVRGSSTGSGATSTETTTISPDDAASIIAGASGTATASSSSATDSSSSSGSNGAAAPPSAPSSTPLAPDFTGPSPDGHVNVIGLSSVPGTPAVASSTPAAASSAPVTPSASSS